MERVHLVCFRLRSRGRTPAPRDARLVTSRMNQPSYSFRALADRRLRLVSSPSLCARFAVHSSSCSLFRFCSVRMPRIEGSRHQPIPAPFCALSCAPSRSTETLFPANLARRRTPPGPVHRAKRWKLNLQTGIIAHLLCEHF